MTAAMTSRDEHLLKVDVPENIIELYIEKLVTSHCDRITHASTHIHCNDATHIHACLTLRKDAYATSIQKHSDAIW